MREPRRLTEHLSLSFVSRGSGDGSVAEEHDEGRNIRIVSVGSLEEEFLHSCSLAIRKSINVRTREFY